MNPSPRDIDEHIILSPGGPEYRTLSPFGDTIEQDGITSKNNQKELANLFGESALATIEKSNRKIPLTQASSDPQSISGKKKPESMRTMKLNGSEKKQFAEDDYCNIMKQHQHPNLIIDLDDDDDLINKSLSLIATIKGTIISLVL